MRIAGMKNKTYWIIALIIPILLGSCSDFRKIQKSSDWEKKYEAALKYYQEKDYYRSSVLLEDVLPLLKGSEKAEKANFYYAYTYFYQDQYLLASHYFKTFYETYGRSQYAEEARYMFGYSLYKDSPRYNLDQSSTYDAIAALQSFINRYPNSSFRDDASRIIDEMQQKLEKKAYEKAKLYFKLRKYRSGEYLKAALVAFNNFQNDYPDSHYVEEIRYMKIQATYLLAEVSIKNKKEERLREAVRYYQDFVDQYPQSDYLKKAENIYDNALNELGKLKS